MRRELLCVIVLVGISSGTLLMAEEKRDVPDKATRLQVETHYMQAHNYAKFGMYDNAIAEYKKALEIAPEFANARFELGLAYVNTERLDDAISEFKKTIEINPNHPRVVYELALAYYDKGMTDEGIALCQARLSDNDPKKGNLHSLLGVLFIKKGDIHQAIPEFRKQIKAEHHPEMGYLNLGMALVKKGDQDEAIEAFKESIKLNSRNPRAHYQLGNAYLKKGMKKEAEEEMAAYGRLTGQ